MSLVEVIVIIGVVALILTAATDSILSLYRAQGVGMGAVSQVSNARAGAAAVMKDLRGIQYGNDGSYPIVSMSTSSITFFTNIANANGAERVTYELSSTTLKRSAIQPGSVPMYSADASVSTAAEYVRNVEFATSLFHYYDESGVEISDMSRVRDVVAVSLALYARGSGHNLSAFLLSPKATLRNLRSR